MGEIPLVVLPDWAKENSCLRAAAEIRINATVIHSSNLRRVNPVASMATVKRAWDITKARREEGTADTR